MFASMFTRSLCIKFLFILKCQCLLTIQWQFPVIFHISFSVVYLPTVNVRNGIKYSTKLILHKSEMLCHVRNITILSEIFHNETSDKNVYIYSFEW